MSQRLITFALLLVATRAAAQERTPPEEAAGRGFFGAPVLKYTTIRDQGATMFGGRGGWNITPSLLMGFGLYGTLSRVDAPDGVMSAAGGLLDIKFETFGLEFEYAPYPAGRTHFTLGATVGGAANRYVRDGTSEQDGETDFMLLLEPTVGVEWKMTHSAHLHLAMSYRVVSGVEQRGLTESDFNGPAVVLGVKFGRF